MFKVLLQVLKATPVVLVASLMVAKGSVAGENKNLIAQTQNNDVLKQIDLYNQEAQQQGQIVNVFQLRDVSPGDWAFEALRSLVERYGCIVGYPDRTFRGNRALSRYEFAAGLNACLNQIERLIAASEAVLREDIDRLQRLLQEFEAELAALGVRVDDLEGRVAFLEDHQFSTTTKLKGETIIGASIAAGGDKASAGRILPDVQNANFLGTSNGSIFDPADPGVRIEPLISGSPGDLGGLTQNLNEARERLNFPLPRIIADPDPIGDEVVLYQRTRLNLNTSFTGRDTLITRLESGNVPNFANATGTDAARLGFEKDTENTFELGKLWYRVPIGEKLTFHLGVVDVDFDDISDAKNPFFESSGSGALSRFGRRNPAIFRTGGSSSLGVNFKFNEVFGVDLAYLTSSANNPISGGTGDGSDRTFGLFNGDYTAAVQLNIEPSERFEIGVAYARSYYPGDLVNLSGSTGTEDGQNPFGYYTLEAGGPSNIVLLNKDIPVSANRFGIQGTARLGERFNINGWFGYVEGIAEEDSRQVQANRRAIDNLPIDPNLPPANLDQTTLDVLDSNIERGDSRGVINAALGVAILDVGKEGSVIGLIAGIPPYAPDTTTQGGASDIPIFVEGQYRFPITRNILITPGIYAIFNPEQNANNSAVFVGTIRTTFRF